MIIACFIAGLSTFAFLTLWVVTSYRELARIRREVAAAAEQVNMHSTLYRQVRTSPNAQTAKKMLDTSRMVYAETVKGYNNCLKNPLYRIPGLVTGFRLMPETNHDAGCCQTDGRQLPGLAENNPKRPVED